MLVFALIAMTAAGGERPYDAPGTRADTVPVYAPPAVPPFEPPSNFGRARAEGDDEGEPHRRPLADPVAVEAYRRSYEYSPSDNEVDYEQGVAQARIDAQARAGALDGVWRVADADGDTLSDLVVSDAGAGGPIDAAWNLGRTSDRGVPATARREGRDVVIETGLGARTARLRLTPTTSGWRGALSRGGREQAVTLIPSSGS